MQTPVGAPPGGWSVLIDNVALTGELDTAAPVVVATSPPVGSAIPHSVSTAFDVTVSDDVTPVADLDVRYRFVSDADPAQTYTFAWHIITGGANRTYSITGNSFAGWLGLASGESFTWIVDARDVA